MGAFTKPLVSRCLSIDYNMSGIGESMVCIYHGATKYGWFTLNKHLLGMKFPGRFIKQTEYEISVIGYITMFPSVLTLFPPQSSVVSLHTYQHTHMHTYIPCIYVKLCMYVCMFVRIYVCMYVCMYLWWHHHCEQWIASVPPVQPKIILVMLIALIR